jgi:hypothetical protein
MCPFCVSGTVLLATSVFSAGGVTALAVQTFPKTLLAKISSLKNQRNGGNDASHSSTK